MDNTILTYNNQLKYHIRYKTTSTFFKQAIVIPNIYTKATGRTEQCLCTALLSYVPKSVGIIGSEGMLKSVSLFSLMGVLQFMLPEQKIRKLG